jgi:hypothetical protein
MVTIRVRSASGALSDSPNLERAAAAVRTIAFALRPARGRAIALATFQSRRSAPIDVAADDRLRR